MGTGKLYFGTYQMAVILCAAVTVTVYQNFAATNIQKSPQTHINEKSRATHARELLGKRYQGSSAQLMENSDSLSRGIFSEVHRNLPVEHKFQARSISSVILQEAEKYQVDPVFILAVIKTESGFNPMARGLHGEIGLMQIKPDTAKWIAKKYRLTWRGAKTLENPADNVVLGMAYFGYLRSKFHGHANKYMSAYNMGVGKVYRAYASENAPRDYSSRIMKNYNSMYRRFATTKTYGLLAEN